MAEILIESDPKQFPPQFYFQRFTLFLERHDYMNADFWSSVMNLQICHYSFFVDFQDLVDFDSALAYALLQFPKLLLPLFDDALGKLQHIWSDDGSITRFGHIRIVGLPAISASTKSSIGAIRASEDSRLIQVYGTVTSSGAIRMLDVSKEYECQNPKCKHRFRVYADPENDNAIVHPKYCTRVLSQSPNPSKCNSTSLREIESSRMCVDFQEIKVQDRLDQLPFGNVPKSITVTLQADLADKCLPGDDVVIVGSIIRKWNYISKGGRSSIDIVLHANSITSLEEMDSGDVLSKLQVNKFDHFWDQYKSSGRELEGRDIIVNAVCSQLYGLFFPKLSLLLSLIGGSKPDERNKQTEKRRTNIHMLMVGDPGCGKSQLLSFAAAIFPRSVLTTGTGTTGAGLTCAAMKDGKGEWTLEAGALVLANSGICCIDEFSSIKEQDRATIHEAMEQQTVSIAKAGLVVKLNTVTTVIASCNFKGQFDASVDLATNTAIGSPLLSRFDIILLMHDIPNKEWDISVSTHLLKAVIVNNKPSREAAATGKSSFEFTTSGFWDLETLRHYILYVRHAFQPVVTDEAKLLLQRYYNLLRQSGSGSQARTTIRILESLLRISEAHAKLMFRNRVEIVDAVVSILCVSSSIAHGHTLPFGQSLSPANIRDMCSSDCYSQQERAVFESLHFNPSQNTSK